MVAALPTLYTERLSLTPLRIEDENTMLAFEKLLEREKPTALWRSDEFYRDRLCKRIRAADPQTAAGMWKIMLDARVVGRVGIYRSGRSNLPELNYALAPDARKAGYATEAVQAVVGWVFENSHEPAIFAMARPSNTASIAVMHRSNMKPHPNTDDQNVVFVVTRPSKVDL